MASLTMVLRANNLNGRLRETLLAPEGAVRTDVQRRARNVRDQAKALCRQRTSHSSGRLPGSIRYTTAIPRGREEVVSQVGSDEEHAIWVEKGTGVYGPRGGRIYPKRARFMRFESNVTGGLIFAESTRGQPGKHYLRDALPAFHR